MALENPYTTVDAVKAEIRNSSADQTTIEDAINAASRWVDEYLKRTFYQRDHSSDALVFKVLDRVDIEREVFLPHYPIIELTEVKLGDDVLVEDDDFTVDLVNGILLHLSGNWNIQTPDRHLSIKGKFGYAQAATTDVPTGIPVHVSLSAKLVAAALSGLNRREIGQLEGGPISVDDRDIPPEVFRMLGRRRGVGSC